MLIQIRYMANAAQFVHLFKNTNIIDLHLFIDVVSRFGSDNFPSHRFAISKQKIHRTFTATYGKLPYSHIHTLLRGRVELSTLLRYTLI